MNWRAATPQQLRMVMWDPGAHPVHRQEAAAELFRRRRQKWGKTNYKMKRVYPK
ncbi:hypothetical protein [Paenibacillus borealis]|uniref:hypothetical protein n=1 Tax=Paenibacillus borealis TaxID=160799 RepID=UPI0012FD3101|nr:hypothetical protein [Paenibacillus borealis]